MQLVRPGPEHLASYVAVFAVCVCRIQRATGRINLR
jgi:hypothetical protein